MCRTRSVECIHRDEEDPARVVRRRYKIVTARATDEGEEREKQARPEDTDEISISLSQATNVNHTIQGARLAKRLKTLRKKEKDKKNEKKEKEDEEEDEDNDDDDDDAEEEEERKYTSSRTWGQRRSDIHAGYRFSL